MSKEDAPFVFADSPAGRQARWFYKSMESRGEGLTAAEVAEHMYFEPPWDPERSIERFKQSNPREGRWRLSGGESPSPFHFEFLETDPNERTWRVIFKVEEEPPHRITFSDWRLELGGIIVREATSEDSSPLAEVEREAPMILGQVSLAYDRGRDFLAFTRLMEENVCFLAEEEGSILGVHCGAFHKVRIGGVEYNAMLGHHSRIPVRSQKRGIFSALNTRTFDHYNERYGQWWDSPPGGYGAYAYTAVDNASALRLGGPGSWSFGPLRALFDCRALSGDDYGRPATPGDAQMIVEILNRCHDNEEMYFPFTVESLTARLERAPELYSWGNLLIGEEAVLGVWPSGLRTIVEGEGERREAVRASTLDQAFLTRAEGEFELLLRSWCKRLLEDGATEVSMLTSEGSANHSLVKRLAFQMDAFAFRMTIPEPEGARERGIYVDGIYF